MSIENICGIISEYLHEGKVVGYEMMVPLKGIEYDISVVTPEYLSYLQRVNQDITDETLKENTNLFPFEDASDFEAACKKIHETDFEELAPFLEESVFATKSSDGN